MQYDSLAVCTNTQADQRLQHAATDRLEDAARDVLQGRIYIKHLQPSALSAPLAPFRCHVCGNVLHAGLVLDHDTCCVKCDVLHVGLVLQYTAGAPQFGL